MRSGQGLTTPIPEGRQRGRIFYSPIAAERLIRSKILLARKIRLAGCETYRLNPLLPPGRLSNASTPPPPAHCFVYERRLWRQRAGLS